MAPLYRSGCWQRHRQKRWKDACIISEGSDNPTYFILPHFTDVILSLFNFPLTLQWRHNGRDSVSNHQPHDCLLNHLFRRRSKKTSKLCVTGLWSGNSLGTGEFPAQMASYAENVSIWWRHHENMPLEGEFQEYAPSADIKYNHVYFIEPIQSVGLNDRDDW